MKKFFNKPVSDSPLPEISSHQEFSGLIDKQMLKQVQHDGGGKRRIAFTLAEVLITLTIIGVIAALTIPNLMKNYQREQFKSGFKKAYSVASDAVLRTRTEFGVSNFSDYMDTDEHKQQLINALYKQFKIVETIDLSKGYKYTYFNYPKTLSSHFVMASFTKMHTLNDGTSISIGIYGHVKDMTILIDTNGTKKAPNRMGYDTFLFGISKNDGALKVIPPYKEYDPINGGVPYNQEKDFYYKGSGKYCSRIDMINYHGNGWHCSHYALIDKNPDDPTRGYWESLEF